MSHRRSHTKSRHGCLQCKKNRTKVSLDPFMRQFLQQAHSHENQCDEERPSCARCVRTGKTCSLLQSDSGLILISDSRSDALNKESRLDSATTSNASVPAQIVTPQDSPDNRLLEQNEGFNEGHFASAELDRLRLMNHYARDVADSIANFTLATEKGLTIWRTQVPRLAFEYEFLLHGLLAVSCLHMAIVQPSHRDKYVRLAIQHYNIGIALYRPQLMDIRHENIDALYAFSCCVALYSFSIHRTGLSQLNSIAKIHEVMTVIRGASVIVKNGSKWLEEGMWAPTLMLSSVEPPGRLSKDMEDVLTELSQRIPTTITTATHSNLYTGAIGTLRQTLWVATTRPHTQVNIVLFPIMVQPEFLTMMCIAEPLALAILANYAVILHWQRNHVWVEGWGKETVEAVHQALPQEWYSCISWAVGEVTRP